MSNLYLAFENINYFSAKTIYSNPKYTPIAKKLKIEIFLD